MRWMTELRAIFTALSAVLVLVLFASHADAQRRRPRPRPRPAAPAPTPAPDVDAPDVTIQPNPFEGAPANAAGAANTAAAAAGAARPVGVGQTGAQTTAGGAAQPGGGAAAQVGEGQPAEPAADAGPDLGPLRSEYTSVMDELVRVRSRVATLGRALFRTRVRILVQNRASDQSLARIALELDGAPIYRADGSQFQGEDGRQVFEGFAAPGPHLVTVEAEQRARANDTYRYTLRNGYRFEVVREKLTEITIVLDDDSDIAEDFADDGEGEYDVRTRVRVATRDLDAR